MRRCVFLLYKFHFPFRGFFLLSRVLPFRLSDTALFLSRFPSASAFSGPSASSVAVVVLSSAAASSAHSASYSSSAHAVIPALLLLFLF